MCLSTVDANARPSSRMVLLKDFDRQGFVFYTNLGSRKAKDVAENPAVALCFFWQQITRQVRIEGDVVAVGPAEANTYFASRPRGSQIGAWASEQSQPIASREQLLAQVEQIEQRFDGQTIPRPPFWSGFRVVPRRFEFWTGEQFRLHERHLYTLDADGSWRIELLSP